MCTRDKSYQNPNMNQPITNISLYNKHIRSINGITCKKYNRYPSFNPIIYNTSITTSKSGVFTNVEINGDNFLPPCYGVTYVNFGSFQNISIVFYSSFNISFTIPLNAPLGDYELYVINVYNNNFCPKVKQFYPGNQNYSNKLNYTLT